MRARTFATPRSRCERPANRLRVLVFHDHVGLGKETGASAVQALKFRSGDRIANANAAALNDPCCDAALSAHRIVATDAQDLLHAGARMTISGHLQQSFADSEPPFLQGKQIDARNDDITTDEVWRDGPVEPEETGDCAQVFRADQRYLSTTAHVLIAITNDPACSFKFGRLDVNHLRSSFRAQADPDNTSGQDGSGHESGEWRLRV